VDLSFSPKYQGSIEVIRWQEFVNEAWLRNKATLHVAGLIRSKPTKFAVRNSAPATAAE
jgi:hypothetical protein